MYKRKLLKLLSAVVLIAILIQISAVTACVAPGTSNPSAQKTLKIGILASLSGWFGGYDTGQWRECQIVADIWNEKGGINIKGQNYKIEPVVEDCKSTLDGYTAACNKLVYDQGIKFLAGPSAYFGSATTSVCEPAKAVRVLGFCTLQPGELTADTKYAFLGRSAVAEMAYAEAKYMKELYPDVKKVVYIIPDDGAIPYIEPVVKKALASSGVEVMETIGYNNETVDFAPIVTKIINRNPDALFQVNGLPIHAGSILKGLRESGWNKPFIGGTTATDVLKIAGKAAGTNAVFSYFLLGNPANPPILEEIGRRIKAKYGPDESLHIEYANSLWVMLDIIQKAQSLDTTVFKETWEKTNEVTGTIYGTARIGGQQTYGIRHVAATPVPFIRLINGEAVFSKWVDVTSP